MKPGKEYQFRAYEVEGEAPHEKEDPQMSPVNAGPPVPRRKHQKEGSSWQVETFLDSRKTHGIKAPKPPKAPKPAKQTKEKKLKKKRRTSSLI